MTIIQKNNLYYIKYSMTPRRIKNQTEMLIYSLHENSKHFYPKYDSKTYNTIIRNTYNKQSAYEVPSFIFKYKEICRLLNISEVDKTLVKKEDIKIVAKLDKIIFPMSQQKDTIDALDERISENTSYGNEIFFTCKNMKGFFSIYHAGDYIVDIKHQIVARLDQNDLKILKDCLSIMDYKKSHRKSKRPINNIKLFHKKYPIIDTRIVSTSNSETIIKHLDIKRAIDDRIPQLIIERAFLNSQINKTVTYYFDDKYYYTNEDVKNNHQLIIDYILKNELKDIKETIGKASSIQKVEDASIIKELSKTKFNAVLQPHQKIGVSWLANLYNKGVPGAILADDMGMGKTIQSIAFTSYLLQTKKIKTILVVAPASVVGVWEGEIKKFHPELKNIIKIQSYESARNDVLEYDLIILDEGQKVKNAKTIAANALSRAKSKFKLILSGTPIENSVQDLFSLIMIITKDASGTLQKILKLSKDDHTHVTTTAKIFEPIMLSRKISSDILPVKLEKHFIEIELSSNEKIVYSGINKFYSKKLDSINNNSEFYREAIVAILRLMQSVSSPQSVPDELFNDRTKKIKQGLSHSKISKLGYLNKLTTKHKQDKFVVFARFKETIKSISSIYPDALVINGDVSKDNRTKIVKEFQEGPVQMIIISLQAGATGLTLTSANKLVFVDLWWNPAVMEQATRRIYRIGQLKDCDIYYLVAKNTIDKLIVQSLDDKTSLINSFEGTNTAKSSDDSKGAVALIDNLFKGK